MRTPTLVILVNGLGADYLQKQTARMPHLAQLAERGTYFKRMSLQHTTSALSSRAALLSGVAPNSNGVYADQLWDKSTQQFRTATANDLQGPTLLADAKLAGLDIASVGFAMSRPSDCNVFLPAYRTVASESTLVDDGRLAALKRFLQLPESWPDFPVTDPAQRQYQELALDTEMLRLAATFVCSDDAPDLLLSEINFVETIQQQTGAESPSAHWAAEMVDTLISRLLLTLWAAGMDDSCNLVICSNYGHAPVGEALFVDNIVRDLDWSSEGGTLLVSRASVANVSALTASLAAYGVLPADKDFLPASVAESVLAFHAPLGMAFESPPEGCFSPTGKARQRSAHGYGLGAPQDDGFAVFVGPEIDAQVVDRVQTSAFNQALRAVIKLKPKASKPAASTSNSQTTQPRAAAASEREAALA